MTGYERVYCPATGIYLGLVYRRDGQWYAEDRQAVAHRHPSRAAALAALRWRTERSAA